jgi:hypothetical protein
MKLSKEIVRIASAEIGVEEIDGTNCGIRVNQFKAATNLDPLEEWPWCAAFICWVVREAMAAANVPETDTYHRPTTASAWGLERWSLKQDNSTWTKKKPFRDILPGDIICFNFSHCAFAVSECDETGFFQTVEGNTDDGGSREGGAVMRRWRRSSQVRSRIRFRV